MNFATVSYKNSDMPTNQRNVMIVFKGSHVQYLKEQEGLHREKSRSSNAG